MADTCAASSPCRTRLRGSRWTTTSLPPDVNPAHSGSARAQARRAMRTSGSRGTMCSIASTSSAERRHRRRRLDESAPSSTPVDQLLLIGHSRRASSSVSSVSGSSILIHHPSGTGATGEGRSRPPRPHSHPSTRVDPSASVERSGVDDLEQRAPLRLSRRQLKPASSPRSKRTSPSPGRSGASALAERRRSPRVPSPPLKEVPLRVRNGTGYGVCVTNALLTPPVTPLLARYRCLPHRRASASGDARRGSRSPPPVLLLLTGRLVVDRVDDREAAIGSRQTPASTNSSSTLPVDALGEQEGAPFVM